MSQSMSCFSPFAPPFPSASTAGPASKAAPAAEDWERHRPIIKRLYLDERRKLKEVVAIMASQHGHNATLKMYKDRINKWRLDKKSKESDMLAILRKKIEREAVGKLSSFRVRGRPVTMEEVLRYFKRKKNTRDQEVYNAPTPSDVSCRTPSPAPEELSLANGTQATTERFSWADQFDQTEGTHCPSTTQNSDCTEMDDMVLARPRSVSENEPILQWTISDMYNLILDGGLLRSPSPPQTLLIPERLLFTIKTYMDGCFEQGSWITDENGDCTVPSTISNEVSEAPFHFRSCCASAMTLLNNGLLVEFRRTLAKAFKQVDTLIRIEHPRTLDFIIEMILIFKGHGRPEIVETLLRYIHNISITLWTNGHPWAHIWQLIGMLEKESLEQALIQSWRCTIDNFEKALGPLHKSSLYNNLTFMQRVASREEVEAILRRLLAQWEKDPNIPNSQTLDIMATLGWNLLHQGRYAEAEQLGLDVVSQAEEEDSSIRKPEAFAQIACSQHGQNKRSLAEKNLRHAIQIIANNWGTADPLAIDFMIMLERWLRQWGHGDKADRLKAEIHEAIGRDEIDEELDGD